MLPRRLSNIRPMRKLQHQISQLRDYRRSGLTALWIKALDIKFVVRLSRASLPKNSRTVNRKYNDYHSHLVARNIVTNFCHFLLTLYLVVFLDKSQIYSGMLIIHRHWCRKGGWNPSKGWQVHLTIDIFLVAAWRLHSKNQCQMNIFLAHVKQTLHILAFFKTQCSIVCKSAARKMFKKCSFWSVLL